MKIYYNPRCSKCRETLQLIESKGKNAEIVDYLKQPPSVETLKHIVKVLGIKAEALVRKKEAIYLEKFKGKSLTENQWLEALSHYPILIERPIVILGNKAMIGRPPEKVLELINS